MNKLPLLLATYQQQFYFRMLNDVSDIVCTVFRVQGDNHEAEGQGRLIKDHPVTGIACHDRDFITGLQFLCRHCCLATLYIPRHGIP